MDLNLKQTLIRKKMSLGAKNRIRPGYNCSCGYKTKRKWNIDRHLKCCSKIAFSFFKKS